MFRSLLILLVLALPLKAAPLLKDGDIVFQDSNSSQSKAIQLATRSPYCHVGLIFIEDAKPYVIEAVQPVTITPFDTWVKRNPKGHYEVKRLKEAATLLSPEAIDKLKAEGKTFLKKNYDPVFEWSDDRIYCSELVWKIYDRALGIELCNLKKLSDFDLSPPAVREKLQERYGNDIPLSEPVVAPSDIYDSALLVAVPEN